MNLIILAIPVYFLLIGIELLIQYFTDRKIYRLNDALTNIGCGIISQLSGLVFKVLSFGAYLAIYEYAKLTTIETTWYTWIILFLLVDLCYYWAHRMSHEINLFWGGHVVHHQSEDYNFSVALRQSSFQSIWTFAFYLPLALIGFKPLDFLLINAITTLYQFWIHTETIGKLGPLEYVFNTPSHHRVHHGKDPKYIDKNHAGALIIWDKLFGTFQKEEEKPVYGITNPINSWNPLWANFDHYSRMWNELKTIKGFNNKMLYLIKKPGWLPVDHGGYRSPKSIDRDSYSKYDAKSNTKIHIYALIQFIIILAITALVLFNTSKLPATELWLGGLWIIGSLVTVGSLFEMKKWTFLLELVRNISLLIYAIISILIDSTGYLLTAFLIIIPSLSILFFMILKMKSNILIASLLLLTCLISCDSSKEIEGFDAEVWISDINGCKGFRHSQLDILKKEKEALKSWNSEEIDKFLGNPDSKDLDKRQRMYYRYDILGSQKCDTQEKVIYLQIRFNSINRADELIIFE